jgi:hypothetical protein
MLRDRKAHAPVGENAILAFSPVRLASTIFFRCFEEE